MKRFYIKIIALDGILKKVAKYDWQQINLESLACEIEMHSCRSTKFKSNVTCKNKLDK